MTDWPQMMRKQTAMGGMITVEMYPGCSIERAAEDAIRIANTLRFDVEFQFNGVRCLAVPGGSSEKLVERQQAEQRRELSGPYDRKFAHSVIREREATHITTSEGAAK